MKKLVKILTLALCLPFMAVSFSSCSSDDDDEKLPDSPLTPTEGVFLTYTDKYEVEASFEFDAIKHPYTEGITAYTSVYNEGGRTLVIKNFGKESVELTATLSEILPVPSTVHANWCFNGLCIPFNGTPIVKEFTLAGGESKEINLDVDFTEGQPAECSFTLTVAQGAISIPYVLQFDYN